MAVSPNGKFLALFALTRLWVVTTDFQTSLADFKTNSVSPPLQLAWCGNDSVLMHWEDTILMVGPTGDYLKYEDTFLLILMIRFPYDGIVRMISDVDSVRIISNDKCEVLYRIRRKYSISCNAYVL